MNDVHFNLLNCVINMLNKISFAIAIYNIFY